jgi:glycine hydroxymethyltransferase
LKEASTPAYATYARQVVANAQALTEGLVAEGMRAVSGGTDTHLALLDLQPVGVTGADAEARCDAAGIVLNKNAIPYDPQPPNVASGIRVGTPSVTTQGMAQGDMKEIASLIARAVRDDDGSAADELRARVGELTSAHPAYPDGGSAAATPGGSAAATPGGSAAATPGGSAAATPGGSAASNPDVGSSPS